MIGIGKSLDWDKEKMERPRAEKALQVSKKDYKLIDMMTVSLLPRWGGEPGDLGKLALWFSEQIKGPEGLSAYMRVVRGAHTEEISLKRNLKGDSPEAYRDFTDPAVVLEDSRAEVEGGLARGAETPREQLGLDELCLLDLLRARRSHGSQGNVREAGRQAGALGLGNPGKLRSMAEMGRSGRVRGQRSTNRLSRGRPTGCADGDGTISSIPMARGAGHERRLVQRPSCTRGGGNGIPLISWRYWF